MRQNRDYSQRRTSCTRSKEGLDSNVNDQVDIVQ